MFTRFIALGDSMTEGMNDELVNGKFRGWADRVADQLAASNAASNAADGDQFTYMNLAVRGKLVGQVLAEQLPIALQYIGSDLPAEKILISFHAGANDVLRPKYDPKRVIESYNEAVYKISETGATLMLFCVLENFTQEGKTGTALAERFRYFNSNVKKIAEEVGAILLDPNPEPFWNSQGFMSWDRLHMNSEGHYRAAQGVLAKLNLPHDSAFREPLLLVNHVRGWKKWMENFRWFFSFALPWIWRRIRGRSSGDGRSGKYLAPVRWPISS
jgi:lysophospholipase L1-like esterase